MRAIDSPHKITPIGAIFRKINYRISKKCTFSAPPCTFFVNKGINPVDDGNLEKVLDILVEHPQLVKNLNELADELRTFYSKLTYKLQYL
jgi:hypothetical protein